MRERLLLLGLMDLEQLERLATKLGVRLSDGRLRALGIARRLARKRSLELAVIAADLGAEQLEVAMQRLGMDSPKRGRAAAVCRALDEHGVAGMRRAAKWRPAELVAVEATLAKVIDGDTIVVHLDGKDVRVRLRGVDTSELSASDKAEADLDATTLASEALFALGEEARCWLESRLAKRRLFLHLERTPTGPGPY